MLAILPLADQFLILQPNGPSILDEDPPFWGLLRNLTVGGVESVRVLFVFPPQSPTERKDSSFPESLSILLFRNTSR